MSFRLRRSHKFLAAFLLAAFLLRQYGYLLFSSTSQVPETGEIKYSFDSIYVINLKSRPDRLKRMKAIEKYHKLKFTYLTALSTTSKEIQRLENGHRDLLQVSQNAAPPYAVWDEYKLPLIDPIPLSSNDVGIAGTDHWCYAPNKDTSLFRDAWQSHLPATWNEDKQLSSAAFACWQSHTEAVREMVSKGEQTALIMEDDVDLEVDFNHQVSQTLASLSGTEWDFLFLGYCWSDEDDEPKISTSAEFPSVHPSYKPQCTHAYALSAAGARKYLEYLRLPGFAFSRPIDHLYGFLIHSKAVRSYSVVPSIITQTRDAGSEIDEGKERIRQNALLNSTLAQLGVIGSAETDLSDPEFKVLARRMRGIKNGWEYN